MPRDIPVGNGNVLAAFDRDYILRDFYYPHVGQENHANGEPFRFGVWADGRFSWLPDGWKITMDYLDDSLVTRVELTNPALGVRVVANDLVDFEEDIFLRRFEVENLNARVSDIRLFLCQNFRIYGTGIGDTAAYRPEVKGLLHYKDERYFLVNAHANKMPGLAQFAAGKAGAGRFEGAWRDAEDGLLSGNPIEQGSVDSAAGISLRIGPGARDTCYYWICAGRNWREVERLNSLVIKKGPEAVFRRTFNYWRLWVDKERLDLTKMPERLVRLYKRSLLIVRTQISNSGGVTAANDSDAVRYNRDTYSYMWPRDGALVAYALDLAGHHEVTRRFFDMCGRIMEKDGYFLHKYTPSGSPASSWHPWLKDGRPQLPIQEDETAIVLWALWRHYTMSRDVEFIRPLYDSLIIRAAEFMMGYRDRTTRLPLASYDLWEERRGVLTFTAAAVHGGLTAAANFAGLFGDSRLAASYTRGAEEVRAAMDAHLYAADKGRFARMVTIEDGKAVDADMTPDASLFGIFAFGAYEPDDPRVASTMKEVRRSLWCATSSGGLARYDGDGYYKVEGRHPGNPWFITTLWLAGYHIAAAKDEDGLREAMTLLAWVADHALPSGVLPEQIDPYTNEPLSVSPLTWSHGAFITTFHEYLAKLTAIRGCPSCKRPMEAGA